MTQILAAALIVSGGAVAFVAAARLFIRLVPWLTRTPPKLLDRKLKPTLIWELAAATLGYAALRSGMILSALS